MDAVTKRRPKFLTGDNVNERRLTSSRKHERAVAKTLGGRQTVGSGNKRQKGDVRVAGTKRALMVEAKATEARSITVKLDWLEKLVKDAHEAGCDPMLTVRFESMKFAGATDWALVPLEWLKEHLS